LLYIAHDRTLQSIVYKLVANLERNELDRQIKFYNEKKLDYPTQLKEKLEQFNLSNNKNQLSNFKHDVTSNGRDEASQSAAAAAAAAREKENGHNCHRNDEQIMLSLEPLDELKELSRKFVLCSSHSTITHLKKLVAVKIYSNMDLYKELDILCNEEILGKDHTLKFINVTKWKNKELPMRLKYRPKLVF
jgi:polycomb group RING finger protein 3